MYELAPVTDRIKKIREAYRTTQPVINISRYRAETEFYMSHTQLNGILKRARNYKYMCENLEIDIHDPELIVGGHAPTFRGAAMFPENDGQWIKDEFVDSDMIRTRDIDPYILSDEDRQYIADTIDFWCHNATTNMIHEYLPEA
ncbi:MAG: pyruvate formate lyase family protein, partial [Coriobacteriales bacterium]